MTVLQCRFSVHGWEGKPKLAAGYGAQEGGFFYELLIIQMYSIFQDMSWGRVGSVYLSMCVWMLFFENLNKFVLLARASSVEMCV